MTQPPWVSGPSEILQHGLSLLKKGTDKNRRLAMLSIDNAVELAIKTYLSLPKRITGINIPRKEFQEISESFPLLLDALEKYAANKLSGINLGEIEWFHRLRNQLYHQGNGLTAEKEKVEIYSELAKILFQNLFGCSVNVEESGEHDLLGKFLAEWVEVERTLNQLANANFDKLPEKSRSIIKKSGGAAPMNIANDLTEIKIIHQSLRARINELRQLRNNFAHGIVDYKKIITEDIYNETILVLNELRKIANT